MAAGSIIIELLLKTGSFETDTKRGERAMRQLKKEAHDLGLAMGAAFAAAGAATAYFVKQAIDTADAAGKAAQAAGIAVESYTALAYAAELAGVENGALGTAMKELNKSIAENDKAFASLGINVRTASGELRKGDDVLAEVADRFQRMEDGPRKAALAVQLFGRAGTQLIPLLNQGSAGLAQLRQEAERLGVVIDSETALAAEQLNDDLTRLKKTGEGLALTLAKEVLPALSQISQRALENAKDFGLARGAFVAFYEAILGGTEPVDLLEKQTATTREAIKGLEEQIAAAERAGARTTGLEEMRAELARLKGEAAGSTQALVDLLNIGRKSAGGGRGFVNPATPSFTPTTADGGSARKVKDASLTAEQIARLQVAADEEAARESAEAWGFYHQYRLREAEQRGEAEKTMWEQIFADIDRRREEADEAARVAAGIGGPAKEASEAAKELGLTFASAFEDAIVKGDELSDVLKGLAQDVLRIFVRKTLTEPLANAISGAIGPMFGGARAGGGPVSAGMGYLVGERGPELFMPSSSGRVVPNSALGGARGTNITIENHGARIEERTESNGDIRLIINAAVAEVDRRIASGTGSTAKALKSRGLNLSGALARRD
jgi:hypothetical protein